MIDEIQEVSVGENKNWLALIKSAFPALKYRNYKLYFTGQLISLIGTWLQIVAQGWLVLTLTHSAFWIGTIAALSTLPILVFSLFGGVIVDRFPKRKIIIFTQSMEMIFAFLLGILAILHIINITQIAIIAFLNGIVVAIDLPARQTFMNDIVEKRDLPSAIALNSGLYNSARIIGPSVAGLLIALVGVGGAFIANGLSFLAVIIALLSMNIQDVSNSSNPNPLKAIKEGIQYSFSNQYISILLVYTCVVSIFGWSFITILPYITSKTFGAGVSELGNFYAAFGAGALVAMVIISGFFKKIKPFVFITAGGFMFITGLLLFTFTNNILLALPLLFITGLGLILQFSTINSSIQNLAEDHVRGRVISIYTLMFAGMSPIGNFQIGYLSDHIGSSSAIRIGALISAAVLIFMLYKDGKIRHLKF
ncbi:MAG: hypothetical protein A2857_04815 [Candidatus Levybacteria bacterium RIFCSPHIGHO2_01_FULL_36_15]|nr:MAG: hypothetical protein A2857_04815 [Candidatus Levybacteria bacterium RIFCSPHIGHO2_01_FULL_36_15]OGH38597.1 MAG: hypothetical protein A2905_04080 [Candidatus Levybacteria bacterium RIFCSPLOWO2_01_FULL_36_10]